MNYSSSLFYFIIIFKFVKSNLEAYITGGALASYNQYPHAVFLSIVCELYFMCGGSILNQDIVLTAAHCMEGCKTESKNIEIKYGHETISLMKTTRVKAYKQHQDYDDQYMMNDICLILVAQRIPLSEKVKRVILMKYPPITQYAYIAGWGLDEHKKTQDTLKHTSAMIQPLEVCQEMGWLPEGTFCAGPITGIGSAEQGDSGGALVIKEYVQIGIVSFSVQSLSFVAYTNTSYHLDWIKKNARALVC